ncbi:adenosine deaminase [Nitriliruptor alkaliphilus]|uniref:adenosine deaminase n=1 Tax=Nitriliruptor alkaliphilus TaxID=427918 RepID=UPI000AEDFF87|nr:adenosine deaminase [Nitriliruptor alkaliphilus]
MDPQLARRAPKVSLHDHLDGGLRVATVRDLAGRIGHPLPADDEESLRAWFFQGGRGADLPRYLEAFDQTVAVLQRADALRRVACEFAEDLADDGIVHGEVRYAPELSTAGGLTYDEVIDAILAGFAEGPADVEVRLIVCALRHLDHAAAAFAAAGRFVDRGVVAVDLAGPEDGFPATAHAAAIGLAREAGLGVTLHAGEAFGPASVADALDAGAQRLGHGVRIVEDLGEDGAPGPVAARVLSAGIPLEVCPTSNVHTGVAADVAGHPIARLRDAGFRITLNTDNRLMSDVTLTSEALAVHDAFGWGLAELEEVTATAVEVAFLPDGERAVLRDRVARGYAALRP